MPDRPASRRELRPGTAVDQVAGDILGHVGVEQFGEELKISANRRPCRDWHGGRDPRPSNAIPTLIVAKRGSLDSRSVPAVRGKLRDRMGERQRAPRSPRRRQSVAHVCRRLGTCTFERGSDCYDAHVPSRLPAREQRFDAAEDCVVPVARSPIRSARFLRPRRASTWNPRLPFATKSLRSPVGIAFDGRGSLPPCQSRHGRRLARGAVSTLHRTARRRHAPGCRPRPGQPRPGRSSRRLAGRSGAAQGTRRAADPARHSRHRSDRGGRRRRVVALVGPTGVGKTTTVAKLAANFKLRTASASAW